MRMRTKGELARKALQLRNRVIDLELLGCARTLTQERELIELDAGYNALKYALGFQKDSRQVYYE